MHEGSGSVRSIDVRVHVQTRAVLRERVSRPHVECPRLKLPRRRERLSRRRAVKPRVLERRAEPRAASVHRRGGGGGARAALLLVLARLDAVVRVYCCRILHGRDSRSSSSGSALVLGTESTFDGFAATTVRSALRVTAVQLAVTVRERLLRTVD